MKERIRISLGSFFISVTLINIAMFILGMLFRPEQRFGYEVFVFPILYGLIGTIPSVLFSSDKELTVRQTIVSEILKMLLITVLLVAFIFGGVPFTRANIVQIVGVAISVMLIYIGVAVIGWFLDLKTAKKMNADLIRFQEKSSE